MQHFLSDIRRLTYMEGACNKPLPSLYN